MNQPTATSNPPRLRRCLIIAAAIVLVPTLTLALLAVGVVRSFGLGPDAAALRDVATRSHGTGWQRKIEVGVGSVTVGVARTALAFLPIEPEVRTALRTFRGGSVGVYQRSSSPKKVNRADLLESADQVMRKRGWERMVGVRNRDELVAVYVPQGTTSPRNARVCVLVVNRDEMVIASVRSDLEPLLELARDHAGKNGKLWAAVRF